MDVIDAIKSRRSVRSFKKKKIPLSKVKRILVLFGGTDPDNVTAKAIEALSLQKFCYLDVDVVVPNYLREHLSMNLVAVGLVFLKVSQMKQSKRSKILLIVC